MPEGDPELPDDGLPDELEEEDEGQDCEEPEDLLRMKVEDLPW